MIGDVKLHVSVKGRKLTVYVRFDPTRIFLGGDYTEMTGGLSPQEIARIERKAKAEQRDRGLRYPRERSS